MHNFDSNQFADDQQDDLLDDLEIRCHTNVAAVRERPARQLRVRVEIYAGNACDRGPCLSELTTSELTEHGLTGLAHKPVMVGSVFQLQFDRDMHITPTLAVCDRCTMLGEASFELRLRFATPVDLSAQ